MLPLLPIMPLTQSLSRVVITELVTVVVALYRPLTRPWCWIVFYKILQRRILLKVSQ